MKARACVGNYSQNAYYFERLDIAVFCMEELAFCLKENAFLLDAEIMNDNLLQFIGADCQVPELARELYPMVHQKGSLSVFVSAILNYVGFFEKKVVQQVETAIRTGSGLTDYEKQKLQIDYLVKKQKYNAAEEAYEILIRGIEEGESHHPKDIEVLADLYYNKGVVYTRMLLYRQAAVCFRRSYELKKDRETMQSYFMAKRMELSEQEYLDLIAKHPECHEVSLQVEQKVEELEQMWQDTPRCMGLKHMRQWRVMGETLKYYEESEQIVDTLKEEYRR